MVIFQNDFVLSLCQKCVWWWLGEINQDITKHLEETRHKAVAAISEHTQTQTYGRNEHTSPISYTTTWSCLDESIVWLPSCFATEVALL